MKMFLKEMNFIITSITKQNFDSTEAPINFTMLGPLT